MLPNDNVSMYVGHLDATDIETLSLGDILQLCRV